MHHATELTPAALAQLILDTVQAHPQHFDMGSWAQIGYGHQLTPDEPPPCGTTMCVAGWAARLTGWTIKDAGGTPVPLTPDDGGAEIVEATFAYAEKDGVRRLISHVAAQALGLSSHRMFWGLAEDALEQLAEIAGR